MYLAWIALILGAQLLAPVAHGQMPPGGELEGAIAKEQADGDLKEAIDAYRRIAANVAAPCDVRARALLQLARCYEKLGQQAQSTRRRGVSVASAARYAIGVETSLPGPRHLATIRYWAPPDDEMTGAPDDQKAGPRRIG